VLARAQRNGLVVKKPNVILVFRKIEPFFFWKDLFFGGGNRVEQDVNELLGSCWLISWYGLSAG
jgi:hypothetical protein